MANFNGRGPENLGPKTGKRMGKCGKHPENVLSERYRAYKRGCRNRMSQQEQSFNEVEVVGVKQCRHRHRH